MPPLPPQLGSLRQRLRLWLSASRLLRFNDDDSRSKSKPTLKTNSNPNKPNLNTQRFPNQPHDTTATTAVLLMVLALLNGQALLICTAACSIAWSPPLVAAAMYHSDAALRLMWYVPLGMVTVCLLCMRWCILLPGPRATLLLGAHKTHQVEATLFLFLQHLKTHVVLPAACLLFTLAFAAFAARAAAEVVCDPIVRTTWIQAEQDHLHHPYDDEPSLEEEENEGAYADHAAQAAAAAPDYYNYNYFYYYHLHEPLSFIDTALPVFFRPTNSNISSSSGSPATATPWQPESTLKKMMMMRMPAASSPPTTSKTCVVQDTDAVLIGRHSITAAVALVSLSFLFLTFLLMAAKAQLTKEDKEQALQQLPPTSSSSSVPESAVLQASSSSSSIASTLLLSVAQALLPVLPPSRAKPPIIVPTLTPLSGGDLSAKTDSKRTKGEDDDEGAEEERSSSQLLFRLQTTAVQGISLIAAVISALTLIALNSDVWDWRPIYALMSAFGFSAYAALGACALVRPSPLSESTPQNTRTQFPYASYDYFYYQQPPAHARRRRDHPQAQSGGGCGWWIGALLHGCASSLAAVWLLLPGALMDALEGLLRS